jgi:hypothetical protein
LKAESAMVEEGSIVVAETSPVGLARNVAPEGSDHPVYRAGFAVTVPALVRLPSFQAIQKAAPVESPAETSAVVVAVTELAAEEQPVEDAPAARSILPEEGDRGEDAGVAEPSESSVPQDVEREIFAVETPPETAPPPAEVADGEAIEDATAEPSIEDNQDNAADGETPEEQR